MKENDRTLFNEAVALGLDNGTMPEQVVMVDLLQICADIDTATDFLLAAEISPTAVRSFVSSVFEA